MIEKLCISPRRRAACHEWLTEAKHRPASHFTNKRHFSLPEKMHAVWSKAPHLLRPALPLRFRHQVHLVQHKCERQV